jgi:hypothetical protein
MVDRPTPRYRGVFFCATGSRSAYLEDDNRAIVDLASEHMHHRPERQGRRQPAWLRVEAIPASGVDRSGPVGGVEASCRE